MFEQVSPLPTAFAVCAGRDVAPASLLACLDLTLAEGESPRKNFTSFNLIFLFFLQASKKLVAATGQQCLPLSIDVRQPQTIVAAVDEALKEFKQIDILVNSELLEWAGGRFGCSEGCSPTWGLCLPSVWLTLLWPGSLGQLLGAQRGWAQGKQRPVLNE